MTAGTGGVSVADFASFAMTDTSIGSSALILGGTIGGVVGLPYSAMAAAMKLGVGASAVVLEIAAVFVVVMCLVLERKGPR